MKEDGKGIRGIRVRHSAIVTSSITGLHYICTTTALQLRVSFHVCKATRTAARIAAHVDGENCPSWRRLLQSASQQLSANQ